MYIYPLSFRSQIGIESINQFVLNTSQVSPRIHSLVDITPPNPLVNRYILHHRIRRHHVCDKLLYIGGGMVIVRCEGGG